MSDPYEVRATESAGNALFATKIIEAGQVILSCPGYLSAQKVVKETLIKDHLQGLDFTSIPQLNEKLILTLYLSAYSPLRGSHRAACLYSKDIDDLPRSLQNGVWTNEELSDLALWPAVLAKRNVLERQWLMIGRFICDFESWKWADSIVSSRTIGLADARLHDTSTESSEDTQALLVDGYSEEQCSDMFDMAHEPDMVLAPILDLCNHAGINRTARWDLTPSDILVLIAERDLSPGEEITISYGDEKTNDELFFNYGFVMPGNPYWTTTLELPVPADVPQEHQRQYWSAIRNNFRISDRIRFSSSSLLNVGEEENSSPSALQVKQPFWSNESQEQLPKDAHAQETSDVTKYWSLPSYMRLSQWDTAALTCSLSMEYIHPEQGPVESLPDCQVRQLTLDGLASLAQLVRVRRKIVDAALTETNGAVKRQLLSDETTGLHRLATEIERLRTYLS